MHIVNESKSRMTVAASRMPVVFGALWTFFFAVALGAMLATMMTGARGWGDRIGGEGTTPRWMVALILLVMLGLGATLLFARTARYTLDRDTGQMIVEARGLLGKGEVVVVPFAEITDVIVRESREGRFWTVKFLLDPPRDLPGLDTYTPNLSRHQTTAQRIRDFLRS